MNTREFVLELSIYAGFCDRVAHGCEHSVTDSCRLALDGVGHDTCGESGGSEVPKYRNKVRARCGGGERGQGQDGSGLRTLAAEQNNRLNFDIFFPLAR